MEHNIIKILVTMADETDSTNDISEAESLEIEEISEESEEQEMQEIEDMQDIHECITPEVAQELEFSPSPEQHEHSNSGSFDEFTPSPDVDEHFTSESLDELELTPSPDLHELPSPEPSDEIVLTPSPDMHSPDLHNLVAPEPSKEIEKTPSSNFYERPTPEPPGVAGLLSNPNPHALLSPEPIAAIELTPNPDLYEQPLPQLSLPIELAPSLGPSERIPELPKRIPPTISTENMQNVVDENDAGISKPDEAQSSEMKEIELEVADPDILERPTSELSQENKSPDPSEGTPEPVRLPKWKLPARKKLLTTENIQKKIKAFEKNACTFNPELAENSDMDSIVSEETEQKIQDKRTTPELPNDIKHKPSPELSEGTPEPIRPPKRKRATRVTLLPAISNTKTQKNVAGEKHVGTSREKRTESSEMENIESGVAEHKKQERETSKPPDEIELMASSEMSEGTPEPVKPPKRRRPAKMRLLPTFSSENRQKFVANKNARSSKAKKTKSSEIEDTDSEAAERQTPEPPDEIKLTTSPELTEGTPEPIRPPKKKRSTRKKMVPTAGRPVKIKPLPAARVGLVQWHSALYSQPGTSTGAQTYGTNTLAGPSVPQARPPIRSSARVELPRTVPRTRVLITPERFTPPGLPARRVLRTPERECNKTPAGSVLRTPSKQRKRMKTARRRQKRSKSVSTPSDTTPSGRDSSSDDGGSNGGGDSGNINGSSDSGDDGDDSDSGGNGDNSGLGGNGDHGKKGASGGNSNIGGSASHLRNKGIAGPSEEVPRRGPDRFAQFCTFL